MNFPSRHGNMVFQLFLSTSRFLLQMSFAQSDLVPNIDIYIYFSMNKYKIVKKMHKTQFPVKIIFHTNTASISSVQTSVFLLTRFEIAEKWPCLKVGLPFHFHGTFGKAQARPSFIQIPHLADQGIRENKKQQQAGLS